jgi:hypothetical protein
MKIYTILDYYSTNCIHGIHSMYLSKDKAQSVSDGLKAKAYQEELQHLMDNEEMSQNEAKEYADNHFPRWLYEVKEMEVEE